MTQFQSLALQAGSSLTTFADLPDLYSKMGEALTLDREDQDFKPIGELVDNYVRKLNEKPKYIPSGISVLDKHLHLSPGNLFIIGGRPSAGKTALSLQMACEHGPARTAECVISRLETGPDTLDCPHHRKPSGGPTGRCKEPRPFHSLTLIVLQICTSCRCSSALHPARARDGSRHRPSE